MPDHDDSSRDVDQFLLDRIDMVPHLEALLLLWNRRPNSWSVDHMAKALFLPSESTKSILDDLVRLRLVASAEGTPDNYRYEPEPGRDRLLAAVDTTYRRELIRITRLIHSKPSAAIREFARAFRLKQDRE
jgi:DNA-binding IclR family transcriptional regulator